jgi:stage V sporulation protein SpoVS
VKKKITELKVSAKSIPPKVAGAIVGALKTTPTVEIYAIGAGAVNQAVKAVAIARRYLSEENKGDITCTPGFCEIKDDKLKTGIKLTVKAA